MILRQAHPPRRSTPARDVPKAGAASMPVETSFAAAAQK
jgi:hypothetical protein